MDLLRNQERHTGIAMCTVYSTAARSTRAACPWAHLLVSSHVVWAGATQSASCFWKPHIRSGQAGYRNSLSRWHCWLTCTDEACFSWRSFVSCIAWLGFFGPGVPALC
jgi:hypothetical protein